MTPNVNTKRVAASGLKSTRNASTKKSNSLAMEDVDPVMQPSQSSSDDGMMATIAQQMQASMEKKKREKEVKFLQAAQAEFTKLFVDKVHNLSDGVAEIEKTYADFREAYASNEDHIRRLWDAILDEQSKLQKISQEKHNDTLEREESREKQHIQALAHCRKACEESRRLIATLCPNYEQT